jgi:hypothetical protein
MKGKPVSHRIGKKELYDVTLGNGLEICDPIPQRKSVMSPWRSDECQIRCANLVYCVRTR